MSIVKYYNSSYLSVINGGISAWQGIRYINENIFLICGTTNPTPTTGMGIIYSGNISFTDGNIFYLNVPSSTSTSVYGPDYDNGIYNFVGSFNQNNNLNITKGFVYTGSLNNQSLNNNLNYYYPSVNNLYNIVFIHSFKNNYLVGNAGNTDNNDTLSFLYNINNLNECIEIKYPGSSTTTSYGIWYDKISNIYIIVGGYSNDEICINDIYKNRLPTPIGKNFIVFFDPIKNNFFNWTTLLLPLKDILLSHIEGISGYKDLNNVFSLSLDIISLNSQRLGYYAVIVPDKENIFRIEQFVNINYPEGISTSNSVANNNIVGLSLNNTIAFQAVIE